VGIPADPRDRRRLVACANAAARSLIDPVDELSSDQYDELLEYVIGLVGEIWARRVVPVLSKERVA
jgi:hypothetical protein